MRLLSTQTRILARSAASIAAALMFSGMVASAAAEADFAGKTIEVIVPFGPGGGADTYARFLSPFLERHLPGNPTLIVRNIPGGGSVIGANRFQERAEPDGLTIMTVSTSTISNSVLGGPEVKYKLHTWVPIILSPSGIVDYARQDLGITGEDLAQDVATLKEKDLAFGGKDATSSELGSLLSFDMLGLEDINTVFGMDRGAARQAFQRGELNINYDSASAYQSNAQRLVDDGIAVPLFAFGYADEEGNIQRDPTFPDMPSFVEAYEEVHGEKPSGPAFEAWKSIFNMNVMASKSLALPADTPEQIVAAYRDAARAMLEDPQFQERAPDVLGEYPQVIGESGRNVIRSAASMDPEARAFLKDWLKRKYDVDITLSQ